MEAAIKVLVFHKRPLLYEGIRVVLEGQEGLSVAGAASDVAEILRVCEESPPEVILVDFHNGEENRLEDLRRIHAEVPDLPIVVYSTPCAPQTIREAASQGVLAFVCEQESPAHLVDAIRSAAAGEYFFGPVAARELVDIVSSIPERDLDYRDDGYHRLTPREREVFKLVAEGLSNKEIAFRLGISRKTVDTHHSRICRKLGVCDAVGLVRYAVRLGILRVE